jgi:hypothetical protein
MSPWDHASHHVAAMQAAWQPTPVAQHQARVTAALPHRIATPHITLRWIPGAATAEERLSIAALLLAGTGFAITATTRETAS